MLDDNNQILEEHHYYPFGLEMRGDWTHQNTSIKNDHLYNGKEWNNELGLGLYDYGARFYDPAIGRFTGVDPISAKSAHVTTYNYTENEPIAHIDLWGLQKYKMKGIRNEGPKDVAKNYVNNVVEGFKTVAIEFNEVVSGFQSLANMNLDQGNPNSDDFHDGSNSEIGSEINLMTGDSGSNASGTLDQAHAKDGATAIIDDFLPAGAGMANSFVKKAGMPANLVNKVLRFPEKVTEIKNKISPNKISPNKIGNRGTRDTIIDSNGNPHDVKVNSKGDRQISVPLGNKIPNGYD